MIRAIKEPAKKTPVLMKVDVIVGGGGTAGFAAAVTAARNGVDVLLIEKYGFLGGACTSGYVTLLPTWNLTPWKKEDKPLISGIARELVMRLDEVGGSIQPDLAKKHQNSNPILPSWSTWFQFDFEAMKIVMLDMIKEAKVKLLLHSYIVDVVRKNNKVKGVIIESKSGRRAIISDVVIDATGDGDISALAGAPFEQTKGPSVMPVTLPFYVGNVNNKKAKDYLKKDPGLQNLLEKKASFFADKTKNVLKIPVSLSLSYVQLPSGYPDKYIQLTRNKEWYIWGAHSFGKDVTNVLDLTRAEVETRQKAKKIMEFIKKFVPGFESSYLVTTATQVGLRESRRISGGYKLTKNDILQGSKFEDVILRSRTGERELTDKNSFPPFDIPYRCVVPEKIDNLLVAGRCISIDHKVAKYFSPRDIATCLGIGEATGTAAALAKKNKVTPRKLKVKKLQEKLLKQGINLGKCYS